METLYSTITTHKLSPHAKPITESKKTNLSSTFFSTQLFINKSKSNSPNNLSFSTQKRRNWVIGSVTEDREAVPVKNKLAEDQESRLLLNGLTPTPHSLTPPSLSPTLPLPQLAPLTLPVEIVHRRSHIHRNLELVPETVGENQRELIGVDLKLY
ncbi:hypothetical protein CFP56_031925 [Quercus suber]|uniref:Uncharacterized protein n=1 Tax=Quercus suber TaxID=58331 RepID=A0AAW0LS87_QUESU